MVSRIKDTWRKATFLISNHIIHWSSFLFFFSGGGYFSVPTSPSLASGLGINPAALPHLLGNSSASQQLLNAMQPQQILQAAQAAQVAQAAQAAQVAQAAQAAQASQQPLLTTSPQQHGHRHGSHSNHYPVSVKFSIKVAGISPVFFQGNNTVATMFIL